jgi:hypothetical protein
MAPLLVEMKTVDAIVIPTERDLVDCLFARDVVFPLEIKQAEVVFPCSFARAVKIRIRLVHLLLGNHFRV